MLSNLLRKILFTCFILFTPLIVLCTPEDALANFLSSRKVVVNEGSVTATQKCQFLDSLSSYPKIKKIAEIGLNAGYSAEIFFKACPELELFASFDINRWDYTKYAVDYFSQKYRDIFFFVSGDSIDFL